MRPGRPKACNRRAYCRVVEAGIGVDVAGILDLALDGGIDAVNLGA